MLGIFLMLYICYSSTKIVYLFPVQKQRENNGYILEVSEGGNPPGLTLAKVSYRRYSKKGGGGMAREDNGEAHGGVRRSTHHH